MLEKNVDSGSDMIANIQKQNQTMKKDIKDAELQIERKEAEISNSLSALKKVDTQRED